MKAGENVPIHGKLITEYKVNTFWEKLFSSNWWLILGGIAISVFLIYVVIITTIKYIKKRQSSISMHQMEDRLAFKKIAIDPNYIKGQLFTNAKNYLLGIYSQNPQILNQTKMSQELGFMSNEKISREISAGYIRTLYNFQIEKERVLLQDNTSFHTVTKMEIEMTIFVDYHITHSTVNNREQKYYKQEFVFSNINQEWVLSEVRKEIPLQPNY